VLASEKMRVGEAIKESDGDELCVSIEGAG